MPSSPRPRDSRRRTARADDGATPQEPIHDEYDVRFPKYLHLEPRVEELGLPPEVFVPDPDRKLARQISARGRPIVVQSWWVRDSMASTATREVGFHYKGLYVMRTMPHPYDAGTAKEYPRWYAPPVNSRDAFLVVVQMHQVFTLNTCVEWLWCSFLSLHELLQRVVVARDCVESDYAYDRIMAHGGWRINDTVWSLDRKRLKLVRNHDVEIEPIDELWRGSRYRFSSARRARSAGRRGADPGS
ncbi:MAG: hypothetical protein RMM29_05145 [Planctomycetota bacterium]|nr:hypothetical protein [Planctomycetota bacterium]MDW8373020.1 hypothetical protein [Planctomycetota bacterium]